MRSSILLALLPSLALALPQDPTITAAPVNVPSSDYDPCGTTSDLRDSLVCDLMIEGFKLPAASYLASVYNNPVLSTLIDDFLDYPSIAEPLSSHEAVIESQYATATYVDDSVFAGFLVSVVSEQLINIPLGTERDIASSVFAQVAALQGGATASAVPTPSVGASTLTESGADVAATATAGQATVTTSLIGATASANTTAPAPSTAVTIISQAAAPRQTGLGLMAGVMVGVVGMAVAM